MKKFPTIPALVFALMVACLLGGRARQASAKQLNPEQISATAKWFIHMDFDAMRESQAGKMIRAMWLSRDRVRKKMDDILDKTGMDLRSDMESVTMYDDRFKEHHGVALIKVKKIDPQKLLARLREKHPDVRLSTYEGNKLYTWKSSWQRGDKQYMTGALYDRSVIVISSDAAKVMEALDVLGGKKPGLSGSSPLATEVSAGTMFLARSIDMSGVDFPGKCPVLRKSDRLSLAFGQDGAALFASCSIVADTENVAANAAAVLNGFRALVSLRHEDDGEVMGVMDGLKVAHDGKSVSFDWRVSGGDLMKAAWKMKKSHRHGHGHSGDWWKKWNKRYRDGDGYRSHGSDWWKKWKQRYKSSAQKDSDRVKQKDKGKDIVDTAAEVKAFSTLVAAVKAADLVEALKGDGPFTVFAPTNSAFEKLPDGTVESLLKPENKKKLIDVLTYHVVPGRVTAKEVVKLSEAKTLQGTAAGLSIDGDVVKIGNARIVKTDILCSNGVIHVIDAVLLPSPSVSVESSQRILFDFRDDDAEEKWRTINDGVMGGLSEGRVRFSKKGTMEFYGNLSLENSGGFASVRSRRRDLGLQADDEIVARIRGDGREYYVNLHVPSRRIAFSYRASVKTKDGEWTEIRIPLKEFYATSFGRRVSSAKLDPDEVNSLGFLLADKKAGPFKLEVAWIKSTKSKR